MPNQSPQIMLWAIAGGVSVGCLVYVFFTAIRAGREEAKRFRALGKEATTPLFKIVRPVGRFLGLTLGLLSARFEMSFGRKAEKSHLLPIRIWAEKRLRSAAHPEGVTADEFIGLMLLGGIVGGGIGILVNLKLQVNPIILGFIAAGLYWPAFWLGKRIHQRQAEIRHDLPYALDLLTISVEAGLDFTEAMARIVEKLGHSALAVELGQTLRDIRLGRTRTEALRDLSIRVDVPELNSLVSALVQADQLGSSLGPILRVQAGQLRTRRSQHAEKLAMEAPVKILLPLILFIFPTIFIMIFGPIILKLFR